MSSGSRIVDTRLAKSLGCGTTLVGYYSTKVWSGNDGRKTDNNYDMSYYSTSNPEMKWSHVSGISNASGTVQSCFGGLPNLPLPVLDPNLELRAISRLAEKFKGHDFNAAVNLGELHEAVTMITSTAANLANAYLSLKKGKISDSLHYLGVKPKSSTVGQVSKDLSKGSAQAWLGLTYGWLPLVGAAKDAAIAAAAQLSRRQTTVRTRFGTSLSGTAENQLIKASHDAKLSVDLVFKIQEEARFTTLEEFGFHDPALVAWELMPYSFVVDWFLPIGDFLEARSVLNNLTGTFVRSEKFVSTIFSPQSNWVDVYQWSSPDTFSRSVTLKRTTGLINQMPLRAPEFKSPFSTSHVASALSLLRTAFR
jgi:hypothetical protein